MAILFDATRLFRSKEVPVNAPNMITAEGQCLVADMSTGLLAAKYSAGAADEAFIGLSIAQQITPLALPAVEEFVQGTSNTITLANTPSGSFFVLNVTTDTEQTAGSPANADEYSISGNVITLNAAGQGDTFRVVYRYAPTTQQVLTFQGNIPPGGAASFTLGSIGVIEHGEVFTTEFDPTVDWNLVQADPVTNVVTCGANGLITVGGTGQPIPGAIVTGLPTVASPYLGIRF